MTVPATARRAGPYSGNGVTTEFGFSFKVFDEADVRVVESTDGVESDAVLNSDYTVALNGDQEASPGGVIIYLSAPAAGTTVTLVSELEYSQPTQLPDGGAYRASTVMRGLDRLAMLIQQVKELFNRAIQFPVSDDDSLSATLPAASDRANKALIFDASGNVGVSVDNYVDQLANVTAQANAAATSAAVSAASAGESSDSADAAAASEAQTLAYLQAYRATSYGALATDPALDPNGNPPTVGDEYFNTTDNLLKRFNGSTWQSSDINTANLAASGGSALVGHIASGTGAVAVTIQALLRQIAVTPEQYGAVGDGVTDDTAAIQRAIDYLNGAGGGIVDLGPKYYAVRGLVVKTGVILRGKGKYATKLRFLPSGDNAADSTAYAVQINSDRGGLMFLGVTGLASGAATTTTAYGNGIRLTPTGELPLFYDVRVDYFAGYAAAPVGGTYGVRQNYARADMTNDAGSYPLVGGNGFVTDTTSANSHMFMHKLEVYYCDGKGVQTGLTNDSWIDVVVGYCGNKGLDMSGTTLGCPGYNRINAKVFLCNVLNFMDGPAALRSLVIPAQGTVSTETDHAAVVIVGRGHRGYIEAQENGSSGVQLGTRAHTLSLSNLTIEADGNGGYDSGASSGTQADYRRVGVRELNAYRNTIVITGDDFRARYGWQRQLRHLAVQSTPPPFNSANTPNLTVGDWYRVTSVAGGADFTGAQIGVASPSNAIGTVFQASINGSVVGNPVITWGSGTLAAVNDENIYIITGGGSYEEYQGTGDGILVDGEGAGSTFIYNGKVLGAGNVRSVSTTQATKITDDVLEVVGTTTINLSLLKRRKVIVNNIGVGTVTLAAPGGTLTGASSLASGEMAFAYCNAAGTTWYAKKFA